MVNYLGTLRGEIGTTEIFTHSIAFTSADTDTQQVSTDFEDAFAEGFTAAGTTFNNVLGESVNYTQFAVAEILDLNTGALFAAFNNPADLPYQGEGTSGAYQCACVISYTGGTYANGTPVRGRTYLPATGTNQVDNGRFTFGAVDAVALFIGTFFAGMVSRGLTPAVWSRKLGSLQAVDAVYVGDVIDTMRSRRNGLVEQRQGVPFP